MASTPPSTADLLCQAEAALHAVQIGQQTVEIAADGYVAKYGPTNIDQLRAYVAYLRGGEIKTVRISSTKGLWLWTRRSELPRSF